MKLICIPALFTMLPVLLLLGGCRKDSPAKEQALNASKVYALPATTAQKELVKNLEKITDVLKELYKDGQIRQEVNAAIASGAYLDESVLLKDLICPESSRLTGNRNFLAMQQKAGFLFGRFSKYFWKEAQKTNDTEFNHFLGAFRMGPNYPAGLSMPGTPELINDPQQITIYFPYHSDFMDAEGTGEPPVLSLVCATADADEGIGYKPYYDQAGARQYSKIIVNDEYAMSHPTHIIGINGTEPLFGQGRPSRTVTMSSEGQPSALGLSRAVKQVFINDVRCRKQYDALISFTGNGGGSEIRFTRGDGFLKHQDGQVQPADIYIMGDHTSLSRKDIKKGRWVNFGLAWDEDWETNNTQQFLAIFEEDNRSESSLDFGVKTTVRKIDDINVDGTIDGKLNYRSDDFIIRQTNYNYDVFFALNRINLEGEMYNGWPVRDKNAHLSFTLSDQTLY